MSARCGSCGRFTDALTFVGDSDERGPLPESGWVGTCCKTEARP